MSRTDKDTPLWVHRFTSQGSSPCHSDACEFPRFPIGGDATHARRHLLYYVKERQAVRRQARTALRDYNRHGRTDIEVTTDPHRRAPWGGGWWD